MCIRLIFFLDLDVLHAIDPTRTYISISPRVVSLLGITFAFLVHGIRVHWGVRIQNTLATFKLFVLVGMAVAGLAVLAGVKKLETVRSLP